MYNGFSNNASTFTALPIAMVAYLALVTALDDAQHNATSTRATGAATLRNTKRDAVWTAMVTLLAYAQSLADISTAEVAASTLEMAGLLVVKTGTHQKDILAAELTTTPGTVHLVANAGALTTALEGKRTRKKGTFNWQWSSDGKTWNNVQSTPLANTDITGLALMTTLLFRVSVTLGKVTGSWSQGVSLLVH
jgi:hypothetical protein